jgi:hypothetical protein
MSKPRSRPFLALVAALALGACASTAALGVAPNQPSYVASVEVIQHDASAPPAFADSLREAVLANAAFYGSAGRPLALRIDLDRVHFKNALQAMIIGDNNQTAGRVAVIDSTAGTQLGAFNVQVDAEQRGVNGGSLAMGVIGALDPTGIVSIASAAGSAASADINRSGTASGMRINFAAETLRQTFGDDRTDVVNDAREDQLRAERRMQAR